MPIGHDLDFDVPGDDVSLHEYPVVAEGLARLLPAELHAALRFRLGIHDAHALAAPARGRLEQERVADFLGRPLAPSDRTGAIVPGTTGTPAFTASALEATLSPRAAMAAAGGPMKTSPALPTIPAKARFRRESRSRGEWPHTFCRPRR